MASDILDRTDFLDKIAMSIAGATIPSAPKLSTQLVLSEDDILTHVADIRPDLMKQILAVVKEYPKKA